MTHVNIRPAKIEDLKAVQDLNHDLFVYDSASDPNLDLDWPYGPTGFHEEHGFRPRNIIMDREI